MIFMLLVGLHTILDLTIIDYMSFDNPDYWDHALKPVHTSTMPFRNPEIHSHITSLNILPTMRSLCCHYVLSQDTGLLHYSYPVVPDTIPILPGCYGRKGHTLTIV